MQINGEAYFLINLWMNFLCLYLSGALTRLRIHAGKCLIASALGGVYAILAWEISFFRGLPFPLLTALLMARCAFGRDFFRSFPLLFAAGFLLAGVSGYLMANSILWLWILLFAAAFSLLLGRVFRRGGIRGGEYDRLIIFYQAKQAILPAFRDSGNLLADPVTALPVIVAPFSQLAPFLPIGLNPRDLSTLPPHFHLIPIQTAGGTRTLMAFHPEKIQLQAGDSFHSIDAIIALSDFSEHRALLPEAIFHQEEGKNASL